MFRISTGLWFLCLAIVLILGCSNGEPPINVAENSIGTSESVEAEPEVDFMIARLELRKKFETTGELESPVRLEADGEPIDIGRQQAGETSSSGLAHAGPTIADVDGDGDQDLLVGDFPGFFWLFENAEDDNNPRYIAKGKLQAGDEAAKTPVY